MKIETESIIKFVKERRTYLFEEMEEHFEKNNGCNCEKCNENLAAIYELDKVTQFIQDRKAVCE